VTGLHGVEGDVGSEVGVVAADPAGVEVGHDAVEVDTQAHPIQARGTTATRHCRDHPPTHSVFGLPSSVVGLSTQQTWTQPTTAGAPRRKSPPDNASERGYHIGPAPSATAGAARRDAA